MPKINSARLTAENRVYIHPVCAEQKDGEYSVNPEWIVLGWADAPWASSPTRTKAIVYEKLTPKNDKVVDTYGHFEPGLYWGHADPSKWIFIPRD